MGAYANREAVERKVAANKDWRQRNRAQHKETQYAWQLRNPLQHMLSTAKQRARKADIEFALTLADFEDIPTHCPVFGFELKYGGRGTRAPNSASLDRIDSSMGYVPGNVQIISWRANDLKGDATVEELQRLLAYLTRSE